MSMDITKIDKQELLDDKASSLADIKVCELALLLGLLVYGDGNSVQDRLTVNKGIITVIDCELARRDIST